MQFGEVMLKIVDYDGTANGFCSYFKDHPSNFSIPVLINGGIESIETISKYAKCGFSGSVCGTMFTFNNNNRNSVLVNYLTLEQLKEIENAAL